MNPIQWNIKHFEELSKLEFHDIIQLRERVFVVEQDCPYLDVDGEDVHTYHVLGTMNEKVVATARIFPPNTMDEVVIGRICNDESTRGKGVGRELVKRSLNFCEEHWPTNLVKISAQCYLVEFYKSFGFKTIGKEYLEDGIPHITMIRS